ncbi:MAG TPA: Uma2 family endonuclease [Pyrinomonadaceae bacterium]|nr:Uma2 family endonuclease [Pyrinomonadaceae bacterium]
MSAKVEPILTIEDLEALPDDGNRYELFEGELFVSRAPGISHQRLLGNIYVAIRAYLEQNPIGEIVITPGLIFNEFNSAIPDAAFFSNKLRDEIISGERLVGAPELVIEIVSPGKENARRDREVKRQVYGKHGVKEYWIADPVNKTLEIYRLKRRNLALSETLMDEDDVTSSVLPGFKCKARQFFG